MSTATTGNICRTCLSTDGELISLFSGTSDTARLTSKLMNISDVTINKRDGLPHMICKKCIFLVESFYCFKKQVHSANKKIEKVWRVTRESRPPEDDSDYEVQYISDEVKREVEKAFRRKQDNPRELADDRTTLRKFRRPSTTPMEDATEKSPPWAPVKMNFSRELPRHGDEKDARTNVTPSSSRLGEETERVEFEGTEKESPRDSSEAATKVVSPTDVRSEYSDCHARLVIVTEEPEDREIERSRSEGEGGRCVAEREEPKAPKCPSDRGVNSGADEARNIPRKSSRSAEDKYVKPAETNESHLPDGKTEAILESEQRNEEETGSSNFENRTTGGETNVEPCSADASRESTSFPDEVDRRESAEVAIELSSDRYGEDRASIENSLGIGEEVAGSERFGETANESSKMILGRIEEERTDVRVDRRSGARREIPDDVKDHREAIRGTSAAARERLDSREDEKIIQPARQLISVKKCYDKKFDDRSIAHERIPVENGTHGAETRIIVISSDSSDDERPENPASAKQRKSGKTLFQSRLLPVKKSLRAKCSKERANEPPANLQSKVFKPRKYFQCTSCNVNLYSVSAVLHHHNQIHTPPQELMHCMMCDVKFPTKTILRAHFDQHVESHLFRCSYCTCEFVLRRNLRAHMNAHAVPPKIEEQPETKRQRMADAELPARLDLPRCNEILPGTNPNGNGERSVERT